MRIVTSVKKMQRTARQWRSRGLPIGFVLGPDADLWTGRLEWRTGPDWAWGVEGSIVRKGAQALGDAWVPGTPVPEDRTITFPVDHDQRAALTADWSPSPSWSLSLAAGGANVESRGNVNGNDAGGAYGSARATLRW